MKDTETIDGSGTYTVDDLLDDTCEFMRRRLPRVSQSDPRRPQAEYVN